MTKYCQVLRSALQHWTNSTLKSLFLKSIRIVSMSHYRFELSWVIKALSYFRLHSWRARGVWQQSFTVTADWLANIRSVQSVLLLYVATDQHSAAEQCLSRQEKRGKTIKIHCSRWQSPSRAIHLQCAADGLHCLELTASCVPRFSPQQAANLEPSG